MKQKNDSSLIISILIPIAVGMLSAFFSGNMAEYSTLNKPAFSPPGIIFPIVWLILYTLMGISSYIIFECGKPDTRKALQVYALQLLFNFFWGIIFFRLDFYFIAFLWVLALIALVALMIYLFYRINPSAAYLQIPYLIWCLFSAYLNFMFAWLN